MGDIADDLIDRMLQEGTYGFACRRGRTKGRSNHRHPQYDQLPKKKVDPKAFDEDTRAREYTGKNTPASMVPDFPEKTFDMSFFPKAPAPKPEPNAWDYDPETAPF